MSIAWIIAITTGLVILFVGIQTATIFWLIKENAELQKLAEENEPPF
jgi:hypothetical protein